MTKYQGMSLVIASLLIGCVGGRESGEVGVSEVRAELAELGVAELRANGADVLFVDASGQQVGHFSTANGRTEVSLGDARAITTTDGESFTVDCNGQGVTLASSEDGPPEGISVVAPCRGALRASTLVRELANEGDSGLSIHQSELASSCDLQWEIGCVDWNATQGCVVYSVCSVISCPDGHGYYRCTLDGH